MRLSTNNEITLATFDGGDWTSANQTEGAIIQTGANTHITVTFDGTTGKIYINGVYNAQSTIPTPIFHTDEYHADI